MKILKRILLVVVCIFAGIGFLFTSVFVAMQFGWLNVRGSIDARNDSIHSLETALNASEALLIETKTVPAPASDYSCEDTSAACPWASTREWKVVAEGLTKDFPVLKRVEQETGVPARLIAAVVMPEQIRFFTANREVFKRYFEPLKILGSLSKFSLGVSGIKQDTAAEVERHALNPHSAFYPGDPYAALLAYNTSINQRTELFRRLTDENNHYYSYLYTAIFIKEILEQWKRAGYDIADRPDIIATIFNIGFDNSQPKPNPEVGGARITVGGTQYSFGELAGLFYRSHELLSLPQ